MMFATAFTYVPETADLSFVVNGFEGEVHIEEIGDAPFSGTKEKSVIGESEFKWKIEEPGDYYYKVYQTPGKDKNVRYDNSEYFVLVSVTSDSEGKLSCNYFVFTDKGKPEQIEFVNETIDEDKGEGEDSDNKDGQDKTGKNEHVSTGDTTDPKGYMFTFCAAALLLVAAGKKRHDAVSDEV